MMYFGLLKIQVIIYEFLQLSLWCTLTHSLLWFISDTVRSISLKFLISHSACVYGKQFLGNIYFQEENYIIDYMNEYSDLEYDFQCFGQWICFDFSSSSSLLSFSSICSKYAQECTSPSLRGVVFPLAKGGPIPESYSPMSQSQLGDRVAWSQAPELQHSSSPLVPLLHFRFIFYPST